MSMEALTYKELANKLGCKVESARKTAQRRRWKRVTGNDGLVRVHVPVEYLDRPTDSPLDSPDDSPLVSPGDIKVRELELMIENLRSILAVETRRAETAEQDRDRWHAFAVRPWWKRLAG